MSSDNPYEPSREPTQATLLPGGTGLMRDGETLSVGYDVFLEDLIQSSLWYTRRSPVYRRNFYRGWLGMTFVLLALFSFPLPILASLNRWDYLYLIAIGWLGALVFFIIYPLRYQAILERNIRQQLNQGSNAAVCGPWRIVIQPERFSTFAPLVDSHYRWQAIDKIERTPGYLLVYITSLSAVVIPARAFHSTAEMEELYAVLMERSVRTK